MTLARVYDLFALRQKSLEAELRSELSGHFRDAAVSWITSPDPTAGMEAHLETLDPNVLPPPSPPASGALH